MREKIFLFTLCLLVYTVAPLCSSASDMSLQQATISAARKIKDSVVAITSIQVIQVYSDVDSMFYSLFPELFGYPSPMKRIGVGSGVIIDEDGY